MVPLPPFSGPPAGWAPGAKEQPGVALMPAAMGHHKNHANLLRALALLPELRLVCTGPETEPLATNLRRLAQDLEIEVV